MVASVDMGDNRVVPSGDFYILLKDDVVLGAELELQRKLLEYTIMLVQVSGAGDRHPVVHHQVNTPLSCTQ